MKIDIKELNLNVYVNYKSIKNLYFRFDEKNNLIVSCPLKVKENEVRALILKNEEEIYKMYFLAKKQNEYNEKFCYLGKEYQVKIVENLAKVGFKDDCVYAPSVKALEKFWFEECMKVFKGEASICQKCFSNLPEYTIKVRKMKTRWGVCHTRKKEITLNSELLKKDIKLIDYVIIHEMCHFFEANHSKNFWELVSAACPDYKNLKKRLKLWS